LYKYDGVSVTLAGEFVQGTQDLGIFELNPVFLDGFVYFTAREGLYRYDGANILGIAGVPVRQDMAVFGDGLYLAGEFQANGSELARFDGNDIVLVADMRAGTESSGPGNFSSFDGNLYFTADSNQSSHAEIWKSDGSGAQIADPSREYFLPSALVTINGQAYFAAANDGDDGYELWRYDGDHSTKVLGRDVNGFDIYPPQLGTFGNELLFWGYGTQGGGDGPTVIGLWAFDGTTASGQQLEPVLGERSRRGHLRQQCAKSDRPGLDGGVAGAGGGLQHGVVLDRELVDAQQFVGGGGAGGQGDQRNKKGPEAHRVPEVKRLIWRASLTQVFN